MDSKTLASKKCVPCSGEAPAMTLAEASQMLAVLPGWELVDGTRLNKVFTFPDFAAALVFTNKVGALAEEEGHHPLICLTWGRATVEQWTHKVNGLTESDFILAAKIDALN